MRNGNRAHRSEPNPNMRNIPQPKTISQTHNAANDSIQNIRQSIQNNGQSSSIIKLNQLSDKQQKQIQAYQNLYKTTPQFVKNNSTNEVYAVFDMSDSPIGKKIGLQSMNVKFGSGTNTINRYYKNGKIVQDVEDLNNSKNNTSTLIQAPHRKGASKKVITQPLNINIGVNPALYSQASASQKNALTKFTGALENKKAELMKDLNIDNDTYNRFAKLAIGIAAQESGLENGLSIGRQGKNTIVGQFASDTLRSINIGVNKIAGTNFSTATSKGLTKIKIGDWDDNPRIAALFKKHGITRGYYNTITPEQSAAATIIVLSEIQNKVKNDKAIQDGMEAANNKFYYTKEILVNGKKKVQPGGHWRYNNVTEDDAILYLYNGRRNSLVKGNATPADNIYTHNVKRYSQLVHIQEGRTERAQAVQKAKTVTYGAKQQKSMKDDLSWGIGQVTFRPDLYTEGARKNTPEEIKMLKNSLTTRGFNSHNINLLAAKLQKGELSFANGLTKKELDTMTEKDLLLLLRHSNGINIKLKNAKTPAQKRAMATSADKNFKKAYLGMHAKRVPLAKVKKSTVKLVNTSSKNSQPYPKNGYFTGAQNRCKRYLAQLRGSHKPNAGLYSYDNRIKEGKYTGFSVEHNKGINYDNASDIDILLAKNGADTASTLKTSGACLTGAKQALIGSGAVSENEMKSFNNAFQLAKFLQKHPERFIEITHVQMGNNQAREITAADVGNLPAGYIVVYGNSARMDVPGHAGTTNGRGQVNADETDNANWDNFVATSKKQDGKGEHGYVRIFKLNPEYFTLSENGKKLVKK